MMRLQFPFRHAVVGQVQVNDDRLLRMIQMDEHILYCMYAVERLSNAFLSRGLRWNIVMLIQKDVKVIIPFFFQTASQAPIHR